MRHQLDSATLPGRGDFDGKALVGPFAPSAQSMDSSAPLYGMPPEALYLWGTLRDDEGDLHSIMRRIPHDGKPTSRRGLLVQSTTGGGETLRIHPCGKQAAAHVDPVRELVGDDAIEWRSNPAAQGAPFRARWANDTCEWIEEGTFELQGKLVGPGMQWYVPGVHGSMAYVATIYQLEGTILGRSCRGFIGFDQVHMYAGGEVYRTLDPLIERGYEHLWYTWATRYTDGSIEAGHFMLGNDRFGFGIVTDENEQVLCTTDVDGEVDFDESGYWQTAARFALGAREYEFLADERGRMPDLGPIPNPQVDGRWQQVGETRQPEVWFAWGEAIPGNGRRPRRISYEP